LMTDPGADNKAVVGLTDREMAAIGFEVESRG